VGPTSLTIHTLRPYDDWESMRTRVEQALTVHADQAEPAGVRRIGVRYIDHVPLKRGGPEPADLLGVPLSPLREFPAPSAFAHRTEHRFPASQILILSMVTLRATDEAQDHEFLALDIDSISQPSSPISVSQAMAVVDELKARVTETFESLITDTARRLFDVVVE
jgi:uncharacterized protein (TIGR04255 family)